MAVKLLAKFLLFLMTSYGFNCAFVQLTQKAVLKSSWTTIQTIKAARQAPALGPIITIFLETTLIYTN